jgi:hypothetical protein
MKKATLSLITPAFLLLSGAGIAIAHNDEPALDEPTGRAEPDAQVLVTLEAPLTSPFFAETPVALVNDEPITFRDLTKFIAAIHATRTREATSARKNYAKLLGRIITTELIVQEARNIGFDELPEFESQVDAKSTELLMSSLMSRHLETVEADSAKVDELYKQMSREFLLSTVEFKNEADAVSFKDRSDSGEDFADLVRSFTEEGRAETESDGREYVKLKDLLPRIAEAAYGMEVDTVSQIFTARKGFLVFHIEDVRFYEDPGVKEEAREKVLIQVKKEAAREYASQLREKHATIDERLLKKADFERERTGFLSLGGEKPVDFEKLLADDRVVATVHSDPPITVTIADLAKQVKEGLYHGVDKAIDRKEELNEKKRLKLQNLLFERVAVLEARVQGLDRTEEYSDSMEKFEKTLLFETFVKRVILPDLKLTEGEVREYYSDHIDEYKSPKMFRMNGLAFHTSSDAEKALEKLRKRADFKWVSANSPGQVERGTEGVLDFKDALLSLTALPEAVRKDADRAQRGDALLYSDPDGLHYVISVEKIFPPTPQAYETARESIARIITDEKMRVLIDEWSDKLKEAYETKIFVSGLDD